MEIIEISGPMRIVSIMVVVELNEQLNFEILLEKIPGAKKNDKMNLVYNRIQPGNYYVAFYSSGKFSVYGIKSLAEIDEVIDVVLNKLEMTGVSYVLKNIEIGNIVMSGEIELNNSLEDIFMSLDSLKASYEPETFPALIYKDGSVSYILFANGKINVTGVKDLEFAKKHYENFIELLDDMKIE